MVSPSSHCSSTAALPEIQSSMKTPSATPARLLTRAGRTSVQSTCGRARSMTTSALTRVRMLTVLAMSGKGATASRPVSPSSTSPKAKPVMVCA
ncbi:Uncharacterised protein [Bordetella pertussis]|nr:Uncharacterised protein [Bordetella pertussis]CFO02135.1 Uncharacterised protein [Bordetella pertussis]CPJ67664.1 Uncharacterised protein [Bordetella pertussis]CPP23515.1 Uncharacterised protein [Bordetella pertussis]CRE30356.1 Uncharacterised protein [Bordetella pertussis]